MAVLIDMDMPRFCWECPFLMLVKDTCAYCMATKYQLKMTELDLRDGMCPLQDVPDMNFGRWIPVNERLPEDEEKEYLVTILDRDDDIAEVYKGFYQNRKWWTQWCHGCLELSEEPCGDNVVTAWMPLPEPYQLERDCGLNGFAKAHECCGGCID